MIIVNFNYDFNGSSAPIPFSSRIFSPPASGLAFSESRGTAFDGETGDLLGQAPGLKMLDSWSVFFMENPHEKWMMTGVIISLF